MSVTFIFGNGLSIAYKPAYYALDALTTAVREKLEEQPYGDATLLDVMDELIDRMSPVAPGHVRSFEEYAGPLERLATSIQQLGVLADVAEDEEDAKAIQRTAEKARDLYVRVVATVLTIVTAHVDHMGDETPIQRVAKLVIETAQSEHVAHVFTLNYDALLDSALLHYSTGDLLRKPENFMLVDDAQGNDERVIKVNGEKLRALGFRQDPYGRPPLVRLYHLHGAATWIRHVKSNEVVKAGKLQDLRDAELWTRWADGKERHLEPVVVLGDRKDRLVTRTPFDRQYAHLQTAVSESSHIVIAGYGFGDVPLNEAIRASLDPATTVWVINPDKGVGAIAREALGMTSKTRSKLLVPIVEGLPDGLETWQSI